jgi:hypothetical protein
MINKPINLAIDEKGRAWVSSTAEYPYAAAPERWADELGTRIRDSRDAIKILDDTDGDGSANEVTEVIATSIMPSNFGELLSEKEFHDLLAWLIQQL